MGVALGWSLRDNIIFEKLRNYLEICVSIAGQKWQKNGTHLSDYQEQAEKPGNLLGGCQPEFGDIFPQQL